MPQLTERSDPLRGSDPPLRENTLVSRSQHPNMDEITGIKGTCVYLKNQITPEVIVYSMSATVGAISAVVAVAIVRDVSQNW